MKLPITKRIVFATLLMPLALLVQAQREGGKTNPLLQSDFWKGKPDVTTVKAQVANGANPAELNGASFDPVVLAINNEAPTETILYLLQQKGNEVNKLTHDGRTYIFWSAARGNTEVMQYLLANGASTNIEDNHGYSAFNFAANGGQQNTAVYDLLLKHGANPKAELTHDGANAVLLAVASDPDLKLTSYLESKGLPLASKDADGNTAFDYAARSGNMVIMKKLLEKGIQPTANAMLMAAQGSRRGGNGLAVFQYLESLGLNPAVTNKNGDNALHALVRRGGNGDVIAYFISKGVNVNAANADGNTAFMNAAASGRDTATLSLLKPLVKDINQKNKAGATALALAVRGASPEVVQYLLNNGAKADLSDATGNNLVYYLFESYSPAGAKAFDAKLKMLQAAGVNIAAPAKDGNTVYHMAVAKNDLALVKMVQSLGADVNAKNSEGITPLHKAAMVSKDGAVLQYLLSVGARKDVKTAFDETAYDLARENEILSKQAVSLDFLK
jgi:ankyrin repeat protein